MEIPPLARSRAEDARDVLEAAPIGVYRSTWDGEILDANRELARILGYDSPQELVGRNLHDVYWDSAERRRLIDRYLEIGSAADIVTRWRRRDGTPVWILLDSRAVQDADGAFRHFDGFVRDVTERVAAQERLRESEERYALVARGTMDGLWDWDVESGTVYFSPRWRELLGETPEEKRGKIEDWLGRVHAEDLQRVESTLARHVEGGDDHFEDEHRVLRRDGSHVWVLVRGVAVRDENGRATRMAGSLTDVSQRKVAEERLRHGAIHDSLTGLPNRTLFVDRLDQALARNRAGAARHLSVLFVDLDRFKLVNESLGHGAGDLLLVEVAARLRSELPVVHTVARLGGDEFAVLLDGADCPEHGCGEAERLLEILRRPYEVDGREVFATASIGIVSNGHHEVRAEELLRDAETAMARAKTLGKDRTERFHPGLHVGALERLGLENDFRRAIDRGELRLRYQPVVSLETGVVVGLEALVRWQHPERGLLGPDAFLTVAEETRAVIPMERWVMEEAARQLALWRAEGLDELTVAINLSAIHLGLRDLPEVVGRVLEQAGVPPARFGVEVTESAVLDRGEETLAVLADLEALGVRLYLDDFGTGYSSLSYLHRVPAHVLKIDRSFVSRLGDGSRNDRVVKAIAGLGRDLEIAIVAEGVETTEQLEAVRRLGCHYAQGFLFAKPLEPEVVRSFVESRAARADR